MGSRDQGGRRRAGPPERQGRQEAGTGAEIPHPAPQSCPTSRGLPAPASLLPPSSFSSSLRGKGKLRGEESSEPGDEKLLGPLC